jgi:hypothetical protein
VSFPLSSVVVTNVDPTLTVAGAQSVIAGQTLSITDLGTIMDPGSQNTSSVPPTLETFSFSINWGDGTTADVGAATITAHGDRNGAMTAAKFNGNHVYSTPGQYTVQVSAEDDNGGRATRSFTVNVLPPPEFILSLDRNTFAENAGTNAATLTVSISGPTQTSPRTITLESLDTSEVSIPASIVVPAGASSATIALAAIDDQLLDGTQTVLIRASGQGIAAKTIDVLVTDHETLDASLNSNTVREDSAQDALRLTVSRSNSDTSPELVTTVTGATLSRLTVPATITIPAGQPSVTVNLTPINNGLQQVPTQLTFTVTATGYIQDLVSVTVLDDEPPKFQNPANRFDVDGLNGPSAGDALAIIRELNVRDIPTGEFTNRGEGETSRFQLLPSDPFLGLFIDVNGDYNVTALDALEIINELNRQAISGELPVQAGLHSILDSPHPMAETIDQALNELREDELRRGILF